MKQKSEGINHFTTNREVEELSRNFKSYGSTFDLVKRKITCDQDKLKNYFETYNFSCSANDNYKN